MLLEAQSKTSTATHLKDLVYNNMKQVSITGSANGIGKAIVDLLLLNNYNVLQFDIEHDISKPENRQHIVEQSKDCDVFINNAWDAVETASQLQMYYDMIDEWHDDKDKHILNMGSLMKYKTHVDADTEDALYSNTYRITKKELHKQTILKHLDLSILCKMTILQPGFTETDFTTEFGEGIVMMKPAQVARQVLNAIESDVHIIESSFKIR
jgi:short-subunit dehydrogenase